MLGYELSGGEYRGVSAQENEDMKRLAVIFGSMLSGVVAASIRAAEPPSTPPTTATSPSASARLQASDDSSAYARQRERLRRAGWLRQETTRRLRNEAHTEGEQNFRAVDDLIDLYIELRLDETLTDAGRERLAGKVKSRLLRIRQRLEKDQPDAGGAPAGASTAAPGAPASRQLADHMARRTAAAAVQLSHHVLAQQGLAGPAGAVAAGAAAAPPFPPDYGLELADLIQTVIAPSTWERNGGPGSIYYYRPRQVLVIRQTGRVHEDIGDVIEQLRRAGN